MVHEAVFPSTVTLVVPVRPVPVTLTTVSTGPLVGLTLLIVGSTLNLLSAVGFPWR